MKVFSTKEWESFKQAYISDIQPFSKEELYKASTKLGVILKKCSVIAM